MSFSMFINFGGNCREAVTFYAEVFQQARPHFLTYGEMDTSFDPNVVLSAKGRNLIANTSLQIAGTQVAFSDMPDNFTFIRGNSMALTVSLKTFAEAQRIFEELAEKGRVFVPLEEASSSYSLVVDQFDISWQISVA